jgi:mono/diheme cytochrome c family protein
MRSKWAHHITTIFFLPIVPLLSVTFLASTAILVTAQEVEVKKVPITQSDPASSKQMFLDYCAPCHGTLGIRP